MLFRSKFQSPSEIYVARTPVGGVPGLRPQTGTGSTEDAVGQATCPLYRVGHSGVEEGRLVPIDGSALVNNLSATAIPGSTWVLAKQDKFGDWWVEVGGGATGPQGPPGPAAAMITAQVTTTGLLPAYSRSGNVITATANGALPTIDGVTNPSTMLLRHGGSFITSANQDNGVYAFTAYGGSSAKWSATRLTTMDDSPGGEVYPGQLVVVFDGSAYADTLWELDTPNTPITVNTTPITFKKLTGGAITRVTQSSNQPLTSGATTLLGWSGLGLGQVDDGGWYSASATDRLTLPAGRFLIGTTCALDAGASGKDYRLYIEQGGTTTIAEQDAHLSSGDGCVLTATTGIFLSVSDFVRVKVFHNVGTTRNILAGANFWAVKVD